VSVLIKFMRVKITNSCVNYTLRAETTLERVAITIVSEYSHAYVSKLLSCVWKPHSACVNRTLERVVITFVRIVIALVSVIITLTRVKITLCVYKSLLCVLNSNYPLDPPPWIHTWTYVYPKSFSSHDPHSFRISII
jgi:hypothetical protein